MQHHSAKCVEKKFQLTWVDVSCCQKIDLMRRMYKLENRQTKHTIECLNMD